MTQPAITPGSRYYASNSRRVAAFLLAAAALVGIGASSLSAQEESSTLAAPPASSPTAPQPKGPIQYVGPDTYILLDAEGRPQPVPGMTYEDFLAAWKKLNQAPNVDTQPHFSIENIKVTGHAHDLRAELKFEAKVHVLADGAVDVPLGLVGAILLGEPKFSDAAAETPSVDKEKPTAKSKPTDEYLDFDPQHGGFIARLSGKSGERRVVSFDLIVPLVREGAETTLALNCPRSVASSLVLSVNTSIADAHTNGGGVLKKNLTTDGGTQLEVAGLTGQFRLSWQSAGTDATSLASVLNSVGTIHVTIDGRGVHSDARLSVRSFGGTFDQFRVRLPRGATLVPATAASATAAESRNQKYRITEESQATDARSGADRAGRIVLVELKEKQQGPVTVELSTEQPGHDASQALELAGFEVIGAVRQYGDIALNVASDWQARWNIGRDVRQVDPTELDRSLQRPDLTAAFQYDRQPWSLAVRVAPRQSRVHVTPEYKLDLLPDEARLDVRLSFQNFGARAAEHRVDIDGWELAGEPVESGGLVDQDRVAVAPKGVLELPLTPSSSRKAEITFTLRRALNRESSKLELPLPIPLADSVATGTLTVHAPAEIELIPDLQTSTGLAAAPARDSVPTADSESGTEFHFRSLLPNAVFSATRANRKGEQAVAATAQVDIGADVVQIEQRFDYDIRYESVSELTLETNADFPIEDEGLEIALVSSDHGMAELAEQRTPLNFEAIVDEGEAYITETRRVRVSLPQPRVGKFTIVARYRISRPSLPTLAANLPVPLLGPVDGRLTLARATATAPRGNVVAIDSTTDATWKPTEAVRSKNGAGYQFVTTRAELSLPLTISAADASVPAATIVDRVWLQTWLSRDIEQDRAAFRLRTASPQITVELPPDAPPGEVEILVDGQPAEVPARASGPLVVRLVRDSTQAAEQMSPEPATHTLEVRFRRPIVPSLITRHRITPPRIEATTGLSQIYWQVVLPGDAHIVDSPDGLVSASQWQWLGSFWGRRPVKSQREIEEWIGATTQPGPADADNQYLYTGLLPVSSITFVTAPRWLIVLLASSTALALAAAWYYLPVAVKPALLVVAIVVIAAAAIAYPTAALLLAQAAVVGVILAALALFVSRLTQRPGRRPVPIAVAPSTQRANVPRSDSIVVPSVLASASTSPTVTLRTSDSER